MKNPEILAPAGSFPAFKAAIAAGADAVYLGGNRFGARAYAGNFSNEELVSAIDYAHLRGRKVYLTVNTLFKEPELAALYDYLYPFYNEGLDAVIVQDYGVLKYVRETFPKLPVHASTQMTVTGPLFAEELEKQGVTRVIPARELSLSEIRMISEATNLEIECFVHGALCYCYSGMCLMSSFIGGRSGNRGRCAQPCRLPFSVYDEKKKLLSGNGNSYALNTKDMCVLSALPDLLDAGISSFKIEGRMKRPEYVCGVVSKYRKYLDRVLLGERSYKVSEEDMAELLSLNNRDGFNKSYYFEPNGKRMMAIENKRLSLSRQEKADALYEKLKGKFIDASDRLPVKGSFTLKKGAEALSEITFGETVKILKGPVPMEAKEHPLTEEELYKNLMKTNSSEFYFEELRIQLDDGLFLPVKQQKDLRRAAFDEIKRSAAGVSKRPPAADTYREYKSSAKRKNALKVNISVLNEKQLSGVLSVKGDFDVTIPVSMLLSSDTKKTPVQNIMARNKRVYVALPYFTTGEKQKIYRKAVEKAANDGAYFLARNNEDTALLVSLGLSERTAADYTLYTMNSYAREFLRSLGIKAFTAPLELNGHEQREADLRDSEVIIYGRTHLMVSQQCLRKNYAKCTRSYGTYTLEDRTKAHFPVSFECDTCENVIYNSVPLSLLGCMDKVRSLNPGSVRVCFTFETPAEAENITEAVLRLVSDTKSSFKENFKFTRGHFNRGVE